MGKNSSRASAQNIPATYFSNYRPFSSKILKEIFYILNLHLENNLLYEIAIWLIKKNLERKL